jgi:hypothetical protein
MAKLDAEAIDDIFSYHTPEPEQLEHYDAIREGARLLALTIIAHTPASADQTAAIRKLRECVMTANAAVALKGKY